uniref:Uncharacterized protein n=1 Tax=Arundo donax TaxID=35708 RepID=A0A0A9FHL8_ARUDO
MVRLFELLAPRDLGSGVSLTSFFLSRLLFTS